MQPAYQPPPMPPAYMPPKKESLIPIVAGILNILGAVAWFAVGALGSFLVGLGLVCVVPGVLLLLAAIFCFQRTNWILAVILSLIGGGIISFILVLIAKEEFDYPQNVQALYPQPYAAPGYPQPQYPQPQYQQPYQQAYQQTPQQPAPPPQPQTFAPPPAPAAPQKVCTSCGNPVEAGQQFCARCGARVT